MREKFMFFQNFKETADKLPDDLRLKYYDAIMDYVFNGKEPDDPIMAALINSIKPSLDKEETRGGNHNPTGQNQYAEVKSGQTGQNRSKGGQSGQSFLETETETETEIRNRSISPYCNSDELHLSPYNGLEKCSCDCERKAKFEINGQKFCGQHTRMELSKMGRLDLMPVERFTKPTLEQIKTYNQELGLGIDEQAFMDFYESKGWKVGSSPMKDWKAAARNWARRDKPKQPDEPMVEIEQGKFYIDDTIPAYADICRRMTPETQERAWKWIMGKFEGQTIKQSIVVDLLNKMAAADERMVANG